MNIDRNEYPTELKDCFVSNLKVMKSGAGYYIGRTCIDKEFGFEEPYSRESDYMNKSTAEAALASGLFEVRDCPENDLAYSNGLPHPQGKSPSSFSYRVKVEAEKLRTLIKNTILE